MMVEAAYPALSKNREGNHQSDAWVGSRAIDNSGAHRAVQHMYH